MDTVATFRRLHAGSRLLLLPNAWDAATAALFRSAGAPAIATTSAGLAWACGYGDGDKLPQSSLLFAVRSICRVAGGVPVTADVENGYSDDPEEVAHLAVELRDAGVSGINLEDGTASPEIHAAKIEAIKRALGVRGDDLFINARTDVYLRELAEGDEAVRETIARGKRYASAGADGFFVPELGGNEAIRAVASAVALPLNLMAVPGLPSTGELYALGVRRLSAGAAISKVAFATAERLASAFMRDGSEVLFSEPAVDYARMNALLA